MRTLKFNVKGQILRADEKCNFENIVAGSKNYLVAEFNFDREWLPYKKAAVCLWQRGKNCSGYRKRRGIFRWRARQLH